MNITEQEIRELFDLIDDMRRGCTCDYDVRCGCCSRLLKVKRRGAELQEKLDAQTQKFKIEASAPITDADLACLKAIASSTGLDTTTVDGHTLERLVIECQEHRQLIDEARCRITAMEAAGLHTVAGLVRCAASKLP